MYTDVAFIRPIFYHLKHLLSFYSSAALLGITLSEIYFKLWSYPSWIAG